MALNPRGKCSVALGGIEGNSSSKIAAVWTDCYSAFSKDVIFQLVTCFIPYNYYLSNKFEIPKLFYKAIVK